MNDITAAAPEAPDEQMTAATIRLRAALDAARAAVPADKFRVTLLARCLKPEEKDQNIVLSDDTMAGAVLAMEHLRIVYQGKQAPEEDFGRWSRTAPTAPGYWWYWPGTMDVRPVPILIAPIPDAEGKPTAELCIPGGQLGIVEAIRDLHAVEGFWQHAPEPMTGLTNVLQAQGRRGKRALKLVGGRRPS